MAILHLRGPLATQTKIDDEDVPRFAAGSWYGVMRSGTVYVAGRMTGDRKLHYLHRLILEAPTGVVVDHIDGDPLNNRRSNLRLCTQAQNLANRTRGWGRNKLRGVSYHAEQGKWRASLRHKGLFLSLGLYDDPDEAAAIRNYVAYRLSGPFAGVQEVEASPLARAVWETARQDLLRRG